MQKLTRRYSTDALYAPYATSEQVLVVGQNGSYKNIHFPHTVIVDIDPKEKPNIVADAHALPFEDASFSLVVAPALIIHVVDPIQVIGELRRVLKPNGTLLFGANFVFPHHSTPHDYWRFTRKGVEKLCASFSSIEIKSPMGEFTTIGVLLERIMLQSDLRGGKFTKGILFIISRLFTLFDGLVLRSYGNIEKSIVVPEIMTPSYFVAAKK